MTGVVLMSEVRKHYFLDEYCIIAPERGLRPSDFERRRGERGDGGSAIRVGEEECVFCLGNEARTPPGTAVYTSDGVVRDESSGVVRDWLVRCFPNRYPVLSPDGCSIDDPLGCGFGFHEVIVETPLHDREPSSFSDAEITRLVGVYKDRYEFYMGVAGVEFVSLFKNHGSSAGASILHSHSQLVALPFVPPRFSLEVDGEGCRFCDIITFESGSERLILMRDGWAVFAPYFSRYPFEVWIAPVKHLSDLSGLNDVSPFALVLRDLLSSMRALFGEFSYNYVFFQCNSKEYHLHVKVFPRFSVSAGFEENTGIYINSVAPEDAAAELRGVIRP